MTVVRARDRAQDAINGLPPERTCFRCDGVFRVASKDRRVYCPACRTAYGFPAPGPSDVTPGLQPAMFVVGSYEVRGA